MFLCACHFLSARGLSWPVALLRLLLHMLFAWAAREGQYGRRNCGGYSSYIRVPYLGVLAFRRARSGRLQYRW